MRCSILLAPWVLLLISSVEATVPSPETACRGIAGVLTDRLLKEGDRDPVDYRHRLDKDGKRYGKVVDFRVSELRALQLLDDLCTTASSELVLAEGPGGGSSGERGWRAGGRWAPSASQQEREHLQKQLENYCARLLDEREDSVVQALRQAGSNMTAVLCGNGRRTPSAEEL